MFTKIKKWFTLVFGNGLDNFTYLEFCNNPLLRQYVELKALELCDTEGIPVFFTDLESINSCSNLKEVQNPACGKFIYHPAKKTNKSLERTECYPRIEVDKSAPTKVFILLHEMGHYFLYKNGIDQSEEKADFYIYTFVKNHLPPFFKWVLQIEMEVYSDIVRDFTFEENCEFKKQAKLFLKKYEKKI